MNVSIHVDFVFQDQVTMQRASHDRLAQFFLEYVNIYQKAKEAGVIRNEKATKLTASQQKYTASIHTLIEDVEVRFRDWINLNSSVQIPSASCDESPEEQDQEENKTDHLLSMIGIWNSCDRILEGNFFSQERITESVLCEVSR